MLTPKERQALIRDRAEQLLALLLATGDSPNLRFLRDLFAKRSVQIVIDDVFPIGKDGKLLFGLTDSPT